MASQSEHLSAARAATAVAVSVLLVLSAPFAGQLRGWIRRQFPGDFVLIVGGAILVGLAVALAAAFVRIRDRKAARFGAIGVALLIAAAYSIYRAGPNAESNAVERFHFLQYGLVTFLFYRVWRPLRDLSVFLLPALAALIVGTAEEWLQWFIPNRVGEMSDIFLNLVAIGTGLLFSAAIDPPAGFVATLAPASRGRVARMAAAAIVAFGIFFHVVHLGHVIVDDEIGTFASRYARDRLLGQQAERAMRWKTSPPPTEIPRLSREDQYLTEGVQHARERNRLWDAGDIRGAWLENRILEKYYVPVLDTPTHEGREGHRWPPAQRADAEGRAAAAAGAPFASRAYPLRIVTWRPWALWIGITALVALLAFVLRRA